MPDPNSRLVYSTDGGRVKPLAPHNRRLPALTASGQQPAVPPDDGIIRIARAKAGRGGKTATAITGLPGSEPELDALLKQLKQHCATGGTREGRTLFLQGDQRDKLLAKLTALGHKAKLAGG